MLLTLGSNGFYRSQTQHSATGSQPSPIAAALLTLDTEYVHTPVDTPRTPTDQGPFLAVELDTVHVHTPVDITRARLIAAAQFLKIKRSPEGDPQSLSLMIVYNIVIMTSAVKINGPPTSL